MKNFKNYLYSSKSALTYGKVFHDKKLQQAIYTDGKFMVISKELYDSSKDIEYIKRNKKTDSFDYHNFNYMRAIYSKDDYLEMDFSLFRKNCEACELTFDSKKTYDDVVENRIYFKDFDFCLNVPMIHVINEFIKDNNRHEMKFYINKNDITKNMKIEAYYDDFLKEGVENLMVFMPIVDGYSFEHIVDNGILTESNGIYHKNIEKLYSWSEMANEFTDRGIPHEVVRNLADIKMAIILNRPIMDLMKFDDYLHQKYGDYEKEGNSMKDIFDKIFAKDSDKMKYYFGL